MAGEGIFITNHDLWKDLPKVDAAAPKPKTVTGQAAIERTPSIFDISAHLNNLKFEMARNLGIVPKSVDVGASFVKDLAQLTARMACIRQKLAKIDPHGWTYLNTVCQSGDFSTFNRVGLNQRMHRMLDRLDHSLSPPKDYNFDPPCGDFDLGSPVFSRGVGKGVFNDRDFFSLVVTAEAEAESTTCPGAGSVPLEKCRLAQMNAVISTLLERERVNHENRGVTVDDQARDSSQYSVWNAYQPNWPCMVVGSFVKAGASQVLAAPDQAVLMAFRDQSLMRAARPLPATALDRARDQAWKKSLAGAQPVSRMAISPLGAALHGLAEMPKRQQEQVRRALEQSLIKLGPAPLPPYRGLSVCEEGGGGTWKFRSIQPRHYVSAEMALTNPPAWTRKLYKCNNVCMVLPSHQPGGKTSVVRLSEKNSDGSTVNGHVFYCYEPCSKVDQ